MFSKPERVLQNYILDVAKNQGFWVSNTNDAFISGKPDMRLSRSDLGQIDIELKMLDISLSTYEACRKVKSGLTKLQFNEIRDMNAGGARAVAMTFYRKTDQFIFFHEEEFVPKMGLIHEHKWPPAPRFYPDFDVAALVRTALQYHRSI